MLNQKKLRVIIQQVQPIKEDLAVKILQEESNPQYLRLRIIEELRNMEPSLFPTIKSFQRVLLMAVIALDQLSETPGNGVKSKILGHTKGPKKDDPIDVGMK